MNSISANWSNVSSLEEFDRKLLDHRKLLDEKNLRAAAMSLPDKFIFETATGTLLRSIMLYNLMVNTEGCELEIPYKAFDELRKRSTPLQPCSAFFLHAYLSECLWKMDRNAEAEEEYQLARAALEHIPENNRPPLDAFLASIQQPAPSA